MAKRYKDRPPVPWVVGHFYRTKKPFGGRTYQLERFDVKPIENWDTDHHRSLYYFSSGENKEIRSSFYWSHDAIEGVASGEVGIFRNLHRHGTMQLLKREEMENPKIHEVIEYLGVSPTPRKR